ncbi:hypothetical protein RB195_019097 [Necator americanus]|uniref:Uncharacterized protein n=1 Tax=Necator americanus TaxID=51031 RepID=A0ABR1CDN8_NECAM
MIRSNVIAASDNTTSETSILQLQTILNTSTNSKEEKRPYLPTGKVTIMDPETKSLSKAYIYYLQNWDTFISGKRQKENPAVLQVSRDSEEFDEWDRNWSMDVAQVLTISTSEQEIIEDEKDQWEKFWSMDAAGMEEFASTEKTARAKMDKILWDRFNETIEQRVDGYYVTLHWKDQYPHLPDNKAIAYRRLVSVWNSLSKDEQLLDRYNSVFKDHQKIIEIVQEGDPVQGNQVHYIPHQPVLTPQKTTTKVRIAFDASAHYKGSPSLNDVLYRGPVILPPLYGLLLRFRIGKIAISIPVGRNDVLPP